MNKKPNPFKLKAEKGKCKPYWPNAEGFGWADVRNLCIATGSVALLAGLESASEIPSIFINMFGAFALYFLSAGYAREIIKRQEDPKRRRRSAKGFIMMFLFACASSTAQLILCWQLFGYAEIDMHHSIFDEGHDVMLKGILSGLSICIVNAFNFFVMYTFFWSTSPAFDSNR